MQVSRSGVRPAGYRRQFGVSLEGTFDAQLWLPRDCKRTPRSQRGPWIAGEGAGVKEAVCVPLRMGSTKGGQDSNASPASHAPFTDARVTTVPLQSTAQQSGACSIPVQQEKHTAAGSAIGDCSKRDAVPQQRPPGDAGMGKAAEKKASAAAAAISSKKPARPWWGSMPDLETKVPQLLQGGGNAAAQQTRALLIAYADEDAPITQFYLGVVAGQLDGEAAACEHYERTLKQLPLLHAARNNLIRGLMKRGSPLDLRQALEHAKLSAGLQPQVAEMQYQLGVVMMQQGFHSEAGSAYEATLKLDPGHRGALVNGVHSLGQLPPGDRTARARLDKIAQIGVAAGLWKVAMQRPPHFVHKLRSQPWWDASEFAWCALLERNYPAIRAEVEELRASRVQPFTPVGGRAAHDHTLVAAGEWREFPLYGNGRKYEDNCARCPITSAIMEGVQAAMELAMAGGGETLFSTLKVGRKRRIWQLTRSPASERISSLVVTVLAGGNPPPATLRLHEHAPHSASRYHCASRLPDPRWNRMARLA